MFYIEEDQRKHRLLLILSVLIGVMFNVLFHESERLGVNYPIFAGTVFVATFFMLRQMSGFKTKVYCALCAINFLYALQYTLSATKFYQMGNFVAIPVVFAVTVLLSLSNPVRVGKICGQLFMPLAYWGRYFKNLFSNLFAIKRLGNRAKGVGIGIVFSIALLLIIIPLMLRADMALEVLASSWLEWIDIDLTDAAQILFWFVLVAPYGYGFVRLAMEGRLTLRKETLPEVAAPARQESSFLTPIKIVLTVLTAVYLVFCAFQLTYVFSGITVGLPADFDYATYARSGFFQLLWLSVINIAVLTLCFKLIKPEEKQRFTQILLTAFTVLTVFVALSSFYRMRLYEAEYGYTALRLHVFLFLYLEFGVLALYIIRIFSTKFPIYRILFVGGLLFYLCMNYMNADAFIARKNIDRYFETGKLDVEYLYSLSANAQPEIVRLAEEENVQIQQLLEYNKMYYGDETRLTEDWRMYNRALQGAYELYHDMEIIEVTYTVNISNISGERLQEVRVFDPLGNVVVTYDVIEVGESVSFEAKATHLNMEFFDETQLYYSFSVNPYIEADNRGQVVIRDDGMYGLQVFGAGD